jgi:hypothetical protein
MSARHTLDPAPWSQDQLDLLYNLHDAETPIKDMGRAIGRSTQAVEKKRAELGLRYQGRHFAAIMAPDAVPSDDEGHVAAVKAASVCGLGFRSVQLPPRERRWGYR